jgi:hypothetical protein
MSMLGGRVPPGREEVGEAVASFPTYDAAQKAVSALITGEVPARDIAIVGKGLRSVERITGRLGYAAAARSGAVSGLMLGLLFSFIFVLGMPTVQISVFIGVLLVGMAIGMLLNLITFAAVRRRRDFASVMQVVADQYEVCVLPPSIHKARGVLGPATTVAAPVPSRAVTPPPSVDDAPPLYGERVTPDSTPPRYGERAVPPAAPAAPAQHPAPAVDDAPRADGSAEDAPSGDNPSGDAPADERPGGA